MPAEHLKNMRETPQTPWSILPADWRDYTQLHHLEKTCFNPTDVWPFWDLLGVLTLPGVVRLKAIVNDEMIGFISGEREPPRRIGWVTSLAVLPDYQRQGIATALLHEGERLLSMPRIRLSVRENNLAAIRLYERCGYRQIELWPSYYAGGENALVYEKYLDLSAR